MVFPLGIVVAVITMVSIIGFIYDGDSWMEGREVGVSSLGYHTWFPLFGRKDAVGTMGGIPSRGGVHRTHLWCHPLVSS